jgi:hypothetical protein
MFQEAVSRRTTPHHTLVGRDGRARLSKDQHQLAVTLLRPLPAPHQRRPAITMRPPGSRWVVRGATAAGRAPPVASPMRYFRGPASEQPADPKNAPAKPPAGRRRAGAGCQNIEQWELLSNRSPITVRSALQFFPQSSQNGHFGQNAHKT